MVPCARKRPERDQECLAGGHSGRHERDTGQHVSVGQSGADFTTRTTSTGFLRFSRPDLKTRVCELTIGTYVGY